MNKISYESPSTIHMKTLTDQQLDEYVYYWNWLEQNAVITKRKDNDKNGKQYEEKATIAVDFNGRRVQTFTILPVEEMASTTFTRGQVIFLFLIIIGVIAGLYLVSVPSIVGIVGLITLFFLLTLLHLFRLIFHAFDAVPEEKIDDGIVHALASAQWPHYTILCPLYKEANIVPQFVKAMSALDYPIERLQILFLTESDDEDTRIAIRDMQLPAYFQIVIVPEGKPRTKPRACNYGLLKTIGEFVVIFDAEDIPDPLQLKKAVLTFSNMPYDVACIQAKLSFYNSKQNILTRWFSLEYMLWFDLMLPGMQATKLSLPLGGTSNHFRTALLKKLGAWDPFNVTEDCDLGLRLGSMKLRTAMLDSITYEEANPQIKNWIRQRSRWIKGYMQTYLVHMRKPLRFLNPNNFREFYSLQIIIGGAPATFFINPLMWSLLGIYILFQPFISGDFHIVYPAPTLYGGALCLIAGNFFYIYIYLIAAARREEYRLMIWAFLAPIYWLMMSIAAIVAVYQLFVKPFHWEKTQHGLHLKHIQHNDTNSRVLSPVGAASVQEHHK